MDSPELFKSSYHMPFTNAASKYNVSLHAEVTLTSLTAHNRKFKWKSVFLACPCHEIDMDEAVGQKSCKYTFKITIYVN